MRQPEACVKRISRRRVLQRGSLCLGTALVPSEVCGQSSDGEGLQHWIEQNAVKMNPGSDPERLLAAVGDARIVMLGEPSHGAGAAFGAKVRLVRLLHERLGFDVLVWESGLIDLERAEAGLRGDLEPVQAAQLGIFKIWSSSMQCRPLFEYVKTTHAGSRPLTMAGFDMQLTAPGTLAYFATELRAFVGTLNEPARDQAKALAEEMLSHFGRLYRYTDARATKATGLMGPRLQDLARLEETAGALVDLLQEGSRSSVTSADRAGFMIRAITSLSGFGANLYEKYGKHSPEETARYALTRENRRDRINAENLKWLMDTAHAGRKIMIWAHNAHVMNAWYGQGFDSVSLTAPKEGMKPTGMWLTGWYGDALYKIGFTTYRGSDGWVGATPAPVEAAPPGSLEERLHRLGAQEVFLPLRSRSKLLPGAPVSMRIPKYDLERVANPAQAFDALYFIDTMTPATSR